MKLYRGINLGGYLSQCNHTKEHYESFIGREDIVKIKEAGFDHIRLPIDYEVLEEEDGTAKEYGFKLVDRVIEWAREMDLELVLDLHKAFGYDFNDAETEKNNLFWNEKLQERFINLWIRMAKRYGNQPDIAFELLNEVVEEKAVEPWNELIAKAVAAIREHAKDTYIIYGGIMWSSIRKLQFLEPPMDDKIIFTFHFYEPLLFTHQKAYWVPTMDPDRDIPYPAPMSVYREYAGDAGVQGEVVFESKLEVMDQQYLREIIEPNLAKARAQGVRVYCGEFGVIDRAPIADALNWIRDISQVFKDNNVGCSIWTYKAKDFGLFDEHYDEIRDEMLKGLL